MPTAKQNNQAQDTVNTKQYLELQDITELDIQIWEEELVIWAKSKEIK